MMNVGVNWAIGFENGGSKTFTTASHFIIILQLYVYIVVLEPTDDEFWLLMILSE
jgi:hypothetical protein